MTNADVIRSMSNEELAEFLMCYAEGDIDKCKTFCDMSIENGCDDCVRWWLSIDSKDHPQGLKYWENREIQKVKNK